MSNSDRVSVPKRSKTTCIRNIKIYKKTKEASLMDVMKRLTIKKRK
jgi:hypothetical protein